MKTEDELIAIGKVVDRLAERFPDLPRTTIELAVLDEHGAFEGRPVRDYVPVLVERGVKARLRSHDLASNMMNDVSREAIPSHAVG
ncbi:MULTISPECIES: three-helix bundle dimerization domain-containing protein [unclassified Cryobacterium]|uniref:three-helix bundle dimerization domain-containing protein n=1 Tax=unclassified Cryobacterium TaxID=2649013 RepID=UPI0034DCC593